LLWYLPFCLLLFVYYQQKLTQRSNFTNTTLTKIREREMREREIERARARERRKNEKERGSEGVSEKERNTLLIRGRIQSSC
jgi:hypothetical protein